MRIAKRLLLSMGAMTLSACGSMTLTSMSRADLEANARAADPFDPDRETALQWGLTFSELPTIASADSEAAAPDRVPAR